MDGSRFHLGGKFVKSALPAELPRTVSVFICRPQFSCSPSLSTSLTAHLQFPPERHWRHPRHVWSRYPVLFLGSRGHPLGHPSWSRDPACCPLLSWSCSHKSWDKTRPGETPQGKGRAGAPPRGRVFPRVPAFSSSVYAGCAGLRFPQPMSLRMPSKLTCAWEPGWHVFPGRGGAGGPSPALTHTHAALPSRWRYRNSDVLWLLLHPCFANLTFSSPSGLLWKRPWRVSHFSDRCNRMHSLGYFCFGLLMCYFISDYFFSDLNCIYYKRSGPVCVRTRAHVCVHTCVYTHVCVS